MSPRLPHLEKDFPQLAFVAYAKTSEADPGYNCVAWAAGDTSRNWTDLVEDYWPPGAIRDPEIAALVSVFGLLGYHHCADGTLETGYEKVALYADGDEWQHAARQLPDGQWTSKLGKGEDIRHPSPADVAGKQYGQVVCYMRRRVLPGESAG